MYLARGKTTQLVAAYLTESEERIYELSVQHEVAQLGDRGSAPVRSGWVHPGTLGGALDYPVHGARRGAPNSLIWLAKRTISEPSFATS